MQERELMSVALRQVMRSEWHALRSGVGIKISPASHTLLLTPQELVGSICSLRSEAAALLPRSNIWLQPLLVPVQHSCS